MCPHTWPAWFTAHLTCLHKAATVVECYISVDYRNKQMLACLIHMAECRCMSVQMANFQEFVHETWCYSSAKPSVIGRETLYNNDVICVIRVQTANVIFLQMLLELDTVPQRKIAYKKQPLGSIAQPKHNGVSWWYPQCGYGCEQL